MKKFVLNLDLQNDKEQQRRALKTVSTLSGIDEISMDLKGKKLTVIGTVDPVSVVSKLRKKSWPTAQIVSVGPAKEPEKKEEPKKEEPKKEEELKKVEAKEEPKKEEAKKEEPKKEEAKKEEEKKPEPEIVPGMMAPMPGMMTSVPGMMTAMPGMTQMPYRPYRQYYPPMPTYYPVHHSVEENPNACVIS